MIDDDFSDFPDFEKYLADLEKLDKYPFKGLSEREIYDIYYDYARIIPSSIGFLSPEKFNYHKFYRARLNIDREKEDLSLIQTYSYPPSVICTKNGRANVKGTSVFYCSDDPNAAILECKPKVGDDIFLSVWKGNASKSMKIGTCLPKDLPEQNKWRDLAIDSFNKMNELLQKDAGDKSLHLITLYNYIAKKYSEEKEPYYITSMLSWEMLHGQLWRDFIIYPTTQADNSLCNMAFHPNSVNEHLKFDRIIKLKIKDINSRGIEFSLGLNVGVLENTKIVWKPRSDDDVRLFKQI